ncbi:hypothetical protein GCM10023148_13840 [Actinokineospora soli]
MVPSLVRLGVGSPVSLPTTVTNVSRIGFSPVSGGTGARCRWFQVPDVGFSPATPIRGLWTTQGRSASFFNIAL